MALDRFLVCGLGSLGQHCVLSLKEFGVSVVAIDRVHPQIEEVQNLFNSLDELIIGDCCQNSILEQAKIDQCRAALLVTSSERVNAETALAIRQINPHIRLVVRSAKTNLNQLLGNQLGNFIAYEPTDLPAQSFALAALGTQTVGIFNLDGSWLRVIQEQVDQNHPWCNRRNLHELNNRTTRVLAHARSPNSLPAKFHQWDFDEMVLAGDTIVYIESADYFSLYSFPKENKKIDQSKASFKILPIQPFYQLLKDKLTYLWQVSIRQKVQRKVIIYGLLVLVLLLISTLIFKYFYPHINHLSAFLTSIVLLLGGYGDIYGGNLLVPEEKENLPMWLRFFSLGLTLVGTALVGILYGFLTETLLSRKFKLLQRRPAVPTKDHVVIVGLGRVGQRVADFLQQFRQPIVGISLDPNFNEAILPDMPLITGSISAALNKANLNEAKSVVVVTDDEILNLEVALTVQSANPLLHLVIRTSGQRLSQHLMAALPSTEVLGMHKVAAAVFAGVAFGENIINLFNLNHQTILVTEYQIEADDNLHGLLLAQVAYGYGLVPILHQRPHQAPKLMPNDDILLDTGDRLFVLATIESLQQVETGKIHPADWLVTVKRALTEEAIFEGGNLIGRISGCPLSMARELMNNLPGTLQVCLYKTQGQRLVRDLAKIQVIATIEPISINSRKNPHW